MEIIKDVDLGTRRIIAVRTGYIFKDIKSQWLHVQGQPVMDDTGNPVEPEKLVEATTVHRGSDGTTCHQCRNNWATQEFKFGMKKPENEGSRPWTDEEVIDHIKSQVVVPEAKSGSLTGATI